MMLKNFFIKTVLLLSQESKCVSHKVGSIIVRDERIIATGYNGSPRGHVNCCDKFSNYNPNQREEHTKWSYLNELHSEINILIFSGKNQIDVEGADMYVTVQPCNQCLLALIQAGIKNVYYITEYDKSNYFEDYNKYINVEKVEGDWIKDFMLTNNIVLKNI